MKVTLEDVLARLKGVRRTSPTQATARCPAHDDMTPSLSITASAGPLPLFKCFAGCTFEEITAALDIRRNGKNKGMARRIVATYDYVDESGALLYQVVRFAPKDFRPRRPDGQGGWTWSLRDVRRVLYCLPELVEQERAFWCEGEKDVDTLRGRGLVATTSMGGVGGWRDDYAEQLVKLGVLELVILPDHDEPGEKYAATVAAACLAAGLRVKVLRLPDLPPKGDVTDWLSSRPTEALAAVADAVPYLSTAMLAESDEGLGLVTLGELLDEPEDAHTWVLEQRLPAAGLGLLAGKPKAGKSTLARCMALAVSRGAPCLGFVTTQGPVIYLALEEKRSELRAHFRALGATEADPIFLLCASAPADALERLRREADRLHPILIIIDPLFRLIRVVDGNDYATMTAALEPLMTLARETGAHVLLVHHLGKGLRAGADAILGSTAIFGAVDSALLMKRGDRFRTLESVQRYGQDLEEIVLDLDPVTRNVTVGGTRAAVEQADAEVLIISFLSKVLLPVTEAELDEGIECRTQPRRAALRALVAAGQVDRLGRGGKADPFRYAAGTRIAEEALR